MSEFFNVEGSKGDIYTVTLEETTSGIAMHCTCPAGAKKTFCKHRLAILCNEFDNVKEQSNGAQNMLQTLAASEKLNATWQEINDITCQQEALKDALAKAKKSFASLLEKGTR